MNTPISLIVGLGNPGAEYANTRHNAGAWFVQTLADIYQLNLRFENKFQGHYAKLNLQGQDCHILIPATFMNLSGQSVGAIGKFFKLNPANILIAHDELDLPPGTVRLKFDGGHGGHNGLRDIIAHLNSRAFQRLRIGIGHPGQAKDVVDYVLQRPSLSDKEAIYRGMDSVMALLPDIIAGHLQKAMKALHTPT